LLWEYIRTITKLPLALLARALALLWAGFWVFFFVAESWAWHTPAGRALPWVGLGVFFVLLALVPWRWELTGALLLVGVGLLAAIANAIWSPPQLPVASRLLTASLSSGPPIAAGVLFLLHRQTRLP
jgi:hypothetical protein